MIVALATRGDRDRALGTGIGWISLSLGLALTLLPRKTAGFLGWEGRERLARVVGAADLVVGMGLLLSPRPSRWMMARTLLNIVIGSVYAGILSTGESQRGRAIVGLCLMSVLTANDYLLSRRLREIELTYNPTTTRSSRSYPPPGV